MNVLQETKKNKPSLENASTTPMFITMGITNESTYVSRAISGIMSSLMETDFFGGIFGCGTLLFMELLFEFVGTKKENACKLP